VPGIDVLFVGPFDLGNNIGHPILSGTMHDELKEAIAKIQRAAKENNKSTGIYSTSGDQAREFADQGFNMVCALSDERCRTTLIFGRSPDICDDGHYSTSSIPDVLFDGGQRFLCAFGVECRQGSNVRTIQDGRGIASRDSRGDLIDGDTE